MLAEMSSSELSGWVAYDRVEPIGELRGDFRSAQICSMLAATHGVATKNEDFMPFLNPTNERGKQSQAEMKTRLRDYFAGHNARVKKKRGAEPSH